MNEIRFSASEDKLYDELLRRRKAYKFLGALHLRACDKCGSYNYVISNPLDMSCECEQCWANRRYIEIVNCADKE